MSNGADEEEGRRRGLGGGLGRGRGEVGRGGARDTARWRYSDMAIWHQKGVGGGGGVGPPHLGESWYNFGEYKTGVCGSIQIRDPRCFSNRISIQITTVYDS